MTGTACPSCAAPMRRGAFERKPAGHVELDICFDCRAIWFDQYESAQLTPGAVMKLFAAIHEHDGAPARSLAVDCRCPRCRQRLVLTQDIQRTNRIAYYRCAQGHGRLSTFFQFLREKSFVRSLTAGEVERLRAHVAQVRCSSCGAPVDLAADAHCGYCRAPISILDADAVRRTLAELDAAERKRHQVDPGAVIDALLAGQAVERRLAAIEGRGRWQGSAGLDLVADALDIFMTKP